MLFKPIHNVQVGSVWSVCRLLTERAPLCGNRDANEFANVSAQNEFTGLQH